MLEGAVKTIRKFLGIPTATEEEEELFNGKEPLDEVKKEQKDLDEAAEECERSSEGLKKESTEWHRAMKEISKDNGA